MKKTKNLIYALFYLCFSFLVYGDDVNVYNNIKTHNLKDKTKWGLLSHIDDKTVTISKKNYKVTGVQGMNVGEKYIYSAKIYTGEEKDKITAVKIFRTDIKEKSTVEMNCPNDNCKQAGHANDITVLGLNGKYYMLVATSNDKNTIARFLISGKNLTFLGYIRLYKPNTDVEKKNPYKNNDKNEQKVASVRSYTHDTKKKIFYLLFKRGETLYQGQISDSEISKEGTTKANIYTIATLDKKNGVFANGSFADSSYMNMETWVAQGFCYNPTEKVIYVPYFKPAKVHTPFNQDKKKSGSCNKNNLDYCIRTSVILTYNVSNVLNNSSMSLQENRNTIVMPTLTSFVMNAKDAGYNGLEVESCGFRTNPDKHNDLQFYFNANSFPESKDGVFVYKNYLSGKGHNFKSVSDSYSIYTVKYDGNNNTGEGKDKTNGNYMMRATRHVTGLKSNLRVNSFTKTGYNFEGWHISRVRTKNGKKETQWLYDVNGELKWLFDSDKKPNGSKLAVYKDKKTVWRLNSGVNNDVITCKAYWCSKSNNKKCL